MKAQERLPRTNAQEHALHKLADAILTLAGEVRQSGQNNNNALILCRIEQMENTIMSKIQEYSDRANAHQDKIDAAVAGLTADVQVLNDKITELQNSAGGITPEDQVLLDAIEARSAAVATKLEALDSLTPPASPTP